MADLYGPPDAELAVVACLAADEDVWVAESYPDHDPAGGAIRASATGGPPPVDRVVVVLTVLVECWHADLNEAWRIARRAWARLEAGAGETFAGMEFKDVSCTGLNNNPDVNRPSMRRVQFLASISSRTILLEA